MGTERCEVVSREKIGRAIEKLEVIIEDEKMEEIGKIMTPASVSFLYTKSPYQKKHYNLFFNTNGASREEKAGFQDEVSRSSITLAETQVYQLPYSLQPNDQKIISFLDDKSLFEHLPFLEWLEGKKVEQEIYVTGAVEKAAVDYLQRRFPGRAVVLPSLDPKTVEAVLKDQTIGTRLSITGDPVHVEAIEQTALRLGLTREEMQVKHAGKKTETIFCVKCYMKSIWYEGIDICPACGAALDVSDHYSRRHDAYLAYILVD